MARNVEIKARAASLDPVRERAAALSGSTPTILRQCDTFFESRSGRLKLREFDSGSGELIYYERENSAGPKQCDYSICPVPDSLALRRILGQVIESIGVVKKVRELYHIGQTRVHLDTVENLGSFIELEVVLHDSQSASDGMRIARELMQLLGIREKDLLEDAYIDMLTREGFTIDQNRGY